MGYRDSDVCSGMIRKELAGHRTLRAWSPSTHSQLSKGQTQSHVIICSFSCYRWDAKFRNTSFSVILHQPPIN